jgi:glycine betaine/proline transport system substrate-binding protein
VRLASRIQARGRRFLLVAAALALSLVVAACGGGGGQQGKGTIEIGVIPWDEAIAVTNLWEHLLEERGYEVEQTQLQVAGLFAGVAGGELDLFLDAWLPATHADYWEQYGEQIDDLGVWLEGAPLTWAVPSYVDIDSIGDLQGKAATFDGKVVGIEAGSGLMRVSRTEVLPAYDLGDSYEVVEGSTPAMLASLDRAIAKQEPIVVTLWQPHFAYAQYDIKNLDDPKNALGDPDALHAVSRQGFAEDFPEVAQWLGNFQLENEPLAELELALNEAGEGNQQEAVKQWVDEHRDLVDSWFQS